MSSKRITGMVFFIIGVLMILFAVGGMKRISTAKGEMGANMSQNAMPSVTRVRMLMVVGIIVAVVGGGIALYCKCDKKK